MFDANQKLNSFRKLRQLVHRQLIQTIEVEGSKSLQDSADVKRKIEELICQIEETTGAEVGEADRRQIETEIREELEGMGPLAPLMLEETISDILVNGPDEVWIDKGGMLTKTGITFDDENHLRRFLDRILDAQGRALDTRTPMVDAKLKDGSRLHAVIPPLSAKGTVVSIRRFRTEAYTEVELYEQGFMTPEMQQLLKALVEARLNIVIAGGASAGKTSLLNLLSKYVPQNERLVTIEETTELKLQHPHVVALEGRVENSEGQGAIALRDLVRTALRMRADRIIVGEVRGAEVWDMLQAMNIGHDGSLSTLHANSPLDTVRRIESLSLMGDVQLPRESLKETIGSSIDIIIQLARSSEGTRRIVNISHLEYDQDFCLHDLFSLEQNLEGGEVHQRGEIPSSLLEHLSQKGIDSAILDKKVKKLSGVVNEC